MHRLLGGIDIESGEVYSAFYGSRCKGLTYESEDKDGYLTMQKRDYDSRKETLAWLLFYGKIR